jgi:hypothetical protein
MRYTLKIIRIRFERHVLVFNIKRKWVQFYKQPLFKAQDDYKKYHLLASGSVNQLQYESGHKIMTNHIAKISNFKIVIHYVI